MLLFACGSPLLLPSIQGCTSSPREFRALHYHRDLKVQYISACCCRGVLHLGMWGALQAAAGGENPNVPVGKKEPWS